MKDENEYINTPQKWGSTLSWCAGHEVGVCLWAE